ncbi:UNKNOWN [Stylonychia lemnae]|uniref:Uncharacterized protein n=1 Tax=Stylonychia lemnae TaxID=5949 RepID=A0A078B9Q2_STYLE|nr:UNKNOWN [Stylonychia lemnae]|eukprot:CDW91164.1 UNKNOWN [Stylonychia lemnae]
MPRQSIKEIYSQQGKMQITSYYQRPRDLDIPSEPTSEMTYNSQMCHDQDAPVPDDAEIEKHLDQYIYDDVMKTPILARRRMKKLRPQQIQKQQFKEFTQMYRTSLQYREWIDYIEDQKANKPAVCLTCWQFVSDQQKNMHLAYGHICIDKNTVTTEARFMHYAKLWKRYTWDEIIFIFAPQNGEFFDRNKMQIINMLSHDMKSCRENKGNMKGQPPFLSAPLVPFNMIPQSASPLAIVQRIQRENQQRALADSNILAIENTKENQLKMKFGSMVQGYNNDNRDGLCQILAQTMMNMKYVMEAQDDMLHKLNLLMIKKEKIVFQKSIFSALETQQEVLEIPIDQAKRRINGRPPRKRGKNAYAAGLAAMYKRISGEDASYIPLNRKYDNELDPDDESFMPDPDLADPLTFDGAAAIDAGLRLYYPNEPQNTGYNKHDWVKVGSTEYYVFIKQLQERVDSKRGHSQICLSCWKFISNHQQRQHEQAGHQCAKAQTIRDDNSFMLNAKSFGRITPEGYVQKFSQQDRIHFQKNSLISAGNCIGKTSNQSGQLNGQPANLQQKGNQALVAMNQMTYDLTPKPQEYSMKPIQYNGSVNFAFESEEKEKIVNCLNKFKDKMKYLEDKLGEMAYYMKILNERIEYRQESHIRNELMLQQQQCYGLNDYYDDGGGGRNGVMNIKMHKQIFMNKGTGRTKKFSNNAIGSELGEMNKHSDENSTYVGEPAVHNQENQLQVYKQSPENQVFVGAELGARSERGTEINNCYQQFQTQEMDLEDYLENSACREVVDPLFNGQYYDQRPAYKSIRDDTVRIGSEDYWDFINRLEQIMDRRIGNHFICLSCWKFVSLMQQKQHQRAGHQCSKECAIHDDPSFMQASRTFGKISLNGCVQKLAPYERNNFIKHARTKNGYAIPMKDFYKNQIIMNEKGKPPYLSQPLTPMNMVPYNNGSSWSGCVKREDEFRKHFETGPFCELTAPKLADQDNINVIKDKKDVLASMAKIHKRLEDTEEMLVDMLHKIRLIVIKDEIENPEAVQQNESLVQLIEIKQSQLQMMRDIFNEKEESKSNIKNS